MFYSPRFRSAALVCLTALMLTACGKKDAPESTGALTATDSVLGFVPADTPYVLASGAPFPDDILDKVEPATEQLLQAYQTAVREVMRETFEEYEGRAEIDGEDVDVDSERVYAVMDEMMSLMSIEGLREAGITRETRLAIYGNGLLPVIRLEVSDPALFDAAVDRMEVAAGAEMETAELDGKTYRYIGDEDARLVVGLFGNQAVLTVAPTDFGDDELKLLFGLTRPAESIAESGRLDSMVREYGLTEHFVGFFDTVRLTDTFLGNPTGLDRFILDAADYDASMISDVCKAEIRGVAAVAPLIVMGYDEVSTEAVGGKMVIRVREDLAKAMTGLAAVVPGLGIDTGGFGSMGVSFNLPALRSFYESQLDAMEQDPYECEHLKDIQYAFEAGRMALQQPMPPFVYGMRGVNAVLHSTGDLDFSNPAPPRDIEATILLAMEDAPSLVAMGMMFMPELAELELEPNGEPVALDVPQAGMVTDTAFAAMTQSAIAVSIGAGAADRAAAALEQESVTPPLTMGFNMDASKYYQLLAESMLEPSGADDGLSPEAAEAMSEAMIAISKIYDRTSFGLRFTEQGVVIDSRATLAD